MRTITGCLLFILGLLLPVAAGAAEADTALATALLARPDLAKGIWMLPQAGDGALASALASEGQGTVLVQALCSDEKKLADLRTRARAEGLLGYRLYAEMAEGDRLPLGNDTVNTVLVTTLTDQTLTTLPPAAEVLRVLTPVTGVALVGLAAGQPGTLSEAKLTAWAKAAGGEVKKDANGLFAMLRKPATPGAGEWTHRLYDSANHMSSSDSSVQWPLMSQWMSRPLLSPQPVLIAAGGRLASITLRGWGNVSLLTVHDLHNGLLLWHKPYDNAALATRTSGLVLQPDYLYLADSGKVTRLDAATGAERDPIDCADLGEQVKWLAIADGKLFAMAGKQEPKIISHQTWKFYAVKDPNALGRGGALGVYDLKAGAWLWKKTVDAGTLDEGYLCVRNGRIYTLLHGKALTCLDAATGKELWTNAEVATKVAAFANGDSRGHVGALMATENYLGIIQPGRGVLVLAGDDGRVLWEPEQTRTASMLFKEDLLFSKGDWRRKTPAIANAATGEAVNLFPGFRMSGGCGSFSYNQHLFAGQTDLTYDFTAGKPLATLSKKVPCLTPPVFADGSLVYGAVACVCAFSIRGTYAQANAIALPAAEELNRPTRLAARPNSDTCAPLPATATDWPTFRAGITRANASQATVPAQADILWRYAPETRIVPDLKLPPSGGPADAAPNPFAASPEANQAVAVGEFVFVADVDGTLTALRRADGGVAWRAFTPGRIYGAPTVWEGRVYVGSGDGRVYCYEATSGRELWRYDVAPLQRRIMVYGDLMNTWPITGGVLVHEGVAYAIAGILCTDGASVVALDAKTGAPRWRNDTSGHFNAEKRLGVSGAGIPAIGNGRLWLRTASYDLKTGECRPYPVANAAAQAARSTGILDTYTGFLGDRYLVTGGRRFFDNTPSTENRAGFDIDFFKLSPEGLAASTVVTLLSACRVMPAWNDQHFLAFPQSKEQTREHREDLLCWDMPKTMAYLGELSDRKASAPHGQVLPLVVGLAPSRAKQEKFTAEAQLWTGEYPFIRAAVLAKNAAVVAWLEPGNKAPTKRYLAAFAPATGETLWKVELPGEPIPDGLAITRDGTALVRLLDGGLVAVGGR